jgi:membrane-bound lytic murein transglycosylase A
MRTLLLLSLVWVGLVGCCSAEMPEEKDYARELLPGQMALEKISPDEYPDFRPGFENREGLIQAIDRSLHYLAKESAQKHYPYLDVQHERVVVSLEAFKQLIGEAPDADSFQEAILRDWDVYRSVGWNGSGEVLFTGYFEPIYEASRTQTDEFRYPLYNRPVDLGSSEDGKKAWRQTESGDVPYYTRRQIDEQGVLAGNELVWLKDRFDAYVIHVQGSARLKLTDGSTLRIGYAGNNGYDYWSVSNALVADGKIDAKERSLETVRRFFSEHPAEFSRYIHRNDRYVFFTERTDGPYGSLNEIVTPYRSIATDKSVFPRAALSFVDATVPTYGAQGIRKIPFQQFTLDQDTGGAIRSAGRCDIFMGTGPEVERLAGHTEEEGRLYYLFLRVDQ